MNVKLLLILSKFSSSLIAAQRHSSAAGDCIVKDCVSGSPQSVWILGESVPLCHQVKAQEEEGCRWLSKAFMARDLSCKGSIAGMENGHEIHRAECEWPQTLCLSMACVLMHIDTYRCFLCSNNLPSTTSALRLSSLTMGISPTTARHCGYTFEYDVSIAL